MRIFVLIGAAFLLAGSFGCGGGESGDAGNSGQNVSPSESGEAAALRANLESVCPRSVQSNFCSRAYGLIEQWIAEEITDDEFINQIIALREGETTATGDPEEPATFDIEEYCTPKVRYDGSSFVEFDYDPSWESLVNIGERAVYTGAARLRDDGRSNSFYTPAGDIIEETTETLRIYSYDPNGTSFQNTRAVVEKHSCVNDQTRMENIFRSGRDVDEPPEYEVSLFFRESLVSSLLERYEGTAYLEIVEDLVRNRLNTWDFVGSFEEDSRRPISTFASCADRLELGRPCLPSLGSREWRAIYTE